MINVTYRGLDDAVRRNREFIRSFDSGGILDTSTEVGAGEALRYAQQVTHVWWDQGGALKAAHRVKRERNGEYTLYIDPGVSNPRGSRPAEYGPAEHARGGDHAFYQRVEQERGSAIADRMYRNIDAWWSRI